MGATATGTLESVPIAKVRTTSRPSTSTTWSSSMTPTIGSVDPFLVGVLQAIAVGQGILLAVNAGAELHRFAQAMLRSRRDVDRPRFLAARMHVRSELARFIVGAACAADVALEALLGDGPPDYSTWGTVNAVLLAFNWFEREDRRDRDELKRMAREHRPSQIPPE